MFGVATGLNCDPPMITIRAALEFAKSELKPDLIIWTGDNSPHDYSTCSAEESMASIIELTKEIKKAYPDTPVVATFGNHDAYPGN